MKQTIRIITALFLLMTGSIGVWAGNITCSVTGGGSAEAENQGGCGYLSIELKVTPADGYTTRKDWITVTNKTTGRQYKIQDCYISGSTYTLHVIKPNEYDLSLQEPTKDNVIVNVHFLGGLKLQSNLANATVTWYDGGNTEPVAASFDPTSLNALTADHLYVSESSYDERKDHYVIAKVVPGAGNWTDASLLRSMEARSMEAGISIAAGTRGIGTDSYRNLTLLKADEYDSGEGVMKPRHDGAGWYYYKIPKDNFFDTGYTTSVLEGDTPEIFDLSNQTVTQDVNAKTVTVSRTTDDWTATLTYDKLSLPFDFTIGALPQVQKISIKKGNTEMIAIDARATIDALIGHNCNGGAPLRINENYLGPTIVSSYNCITGSDLTVSKFSITVPFPGEGTDKKPWLIQGAEKLSLLAKCVNVGACDFAGKNVKLDNGESYSYDMSAYNDATSPKCFEPIGLTGDIYQTPFCGTFDGNNVTISGINYIFNPGAIAGDVSFVNSIGLFGQLGIYADDPEKRKEGTVKNLTLSNCTFASKYDKACYVGGVVGYIDNGSLSGATLSGGCDVSATKAGSYVGAVVGHANTTASTLANNYYKYDTKVTLGEASATGYAKRGIGTATGSDDVATNGGAMLLVKKASLGTITKPTDSKAVVAFNENTVGTNCYAVNDNNIYYAVGQKVTLTVVPDTRTTGILTFLNELTALTMNDATTNTDIIETRVFTMPESDVTVSATFKQSDWFTVKTNGKEWMSFFQNLGNYIVSAISSGASGLELLTISGIDFSKGIATLKDLGGICFKGVPMLLYCKGGLPEQLLFSPVTGKTAPQFDPQFKGGVSDLSAFDGLSVYVLFGSELVKVDLSDSKLFDIYKAFVVAASTKSATRLALVRDGATAIDLVTTPDEGEGKWFDLQGRQLDGKPSKKGLYIRDGKKMIIK